jgi:hypothetical protein
MHLELVRLADLYALFIDQHNPLGHVDLNVVNENSS